MKILYVTSKTFNPEISTCGGGVINNRNYRLLCALGNIEVAVNFLKPSKPTKIRLLELFRKTGRVFLTKIPLAFYSREVRQLKKIIAYKKWDVIFFDNSVVGGLARTAKESGACVITFFHNVEFNYYRNVGKILRYRARRVKKCEYESIKHSDILIVLNERDKKELSDIYDKNDKFTDKIRIVPATVKDRFNPNENNTDPDMGKSGHVGLFLGSFFPPNYNGVKWFVKRVAPYLNCNIKIAGSGFESVRAKLERKNVEVIGSIEDTKQICLQADFIVSPIFEGEGMKVKTAESLMYGKTIFGTTESWEGYDADYEKAGGLCNTAEEFIAAINNGVANNTIKRYNEYSRNIYLAKYSDDVALKEFAKIFGEIK